MRHKQIKILIKNVGTVQSFAYMFLFYHFLASSWLHQSYMVGVVILRCALMLTLARLMSTTSSLYIRATYNWREIRELQIAIL
jgi:hypothetical protein